MKLDKFQVQLVEEVKAARKIAMEVFATKDPSAEETHGVAARMYAFEDKDEQKGAVERLKFAAAQAIEIHGTDDAEGVFALYDLLFGEGEEDEE